MPCTTSTNVLSPLSESNLQEENYNKMQDISSSPACSSQAGHTATEKPCSTIYLFRGHEYVQLKPRSAILEEGIRRLHPPPVASPPVKRCSAWNASWNISRFPCKKGKQKVRISGGGNAYLFFFFPPFPCPFAKPTKAAPAWERRLRRSARSRGRDARRCPCSQQAQRGTSTPSAARRAAVARRQRCLN